MSSRRTRFPYNNSEPTIAVARKYAPRDFHVSAHGHIYAFSLLFGMVSVQITESAKAS